MAEIRWQTSVRGWAGCSFAGELQGVLGRRLNADQGLLVAWGGLNQVAEREIRQQFFQVRVWDAEDVLRELTAVYDKLPGDIQAELPLKQIWTLADQDEQ